MNLTSKLILHLDDDRFLQTVPAVQSDTARSVEVALYAGGQPWDIPPEATASIRYRRADGAGGVYDTLSDGSKAWSISGNTVTIALDAAVLGVPGTATMQIAMRRDEEVLSTFSFQIQVQADPSVGTSAPEVPPQSGSGTVELQPLTFTGAVKATYDGKKAVTVNIPTGGGNNASYTLPVASPTTLGGVKPVTKTASMTQPIGVDAEGRLYTEPSDEGGGNAEDGYDGDCSCGSYTMEIVLEEEVAAIQIDLPCNFSSILYGNFHFAIPDLTTQMSIYARMGHPSSHTKSFGNAVASDGGNNTTGVDVMVWRYMDGKYFYSFNSQKNYPENTRPTNATGMGQCGDESMAIFYSNTSGVNFPAGTTINLWGVYSK